MNKYFLAAVLFAGAINLASAYKPAGNNIMTTWGENIDPANIWQEYPRPIMEREDWQNLNGLWDYAIVSKDSPRPKEWQGEILVPFCAESALSGVGKEVGEENAQIGRASCRERVVEGV